MVTATWDRVRLSRASDEIVSQLTDALFDGRLQPGEALGTESELAAHFGVSRASVREDVQRQRAWWQRAERRQRT